MLINNKSLIKTINKLNLTDDEREKFNKISEDDNGNFVYNGKPVTGGATAEQIAQIQANKTAIGDSNSGLVKEVNNIKNTELQNLNTAINTLETLVGDKTGLPSGDANIIASINRIDRKTTTGNGLTPEQSQQLQTAYEHSQSDHVTMDEVNAAISNITTGEGGSSHTHANMSILNTITKENRYVTQEEYNALTNEEKNSDVIIWNIINDEDTIILTLDGNELNLVRNGVIVSTVTLNISSGGGSSEIYGSIVPSNTTLNVNEGDTATFTVKLNVSPTSEQTVNITSNNSQVTVSPSSLIFDSSNYNIAQTVTVTASEDDIKENITADLTLISTGVASKTVKVTVINNDFEEGEVTGCAYLYDISTFNETDSTWENKNSEKVNTITATGCSISDNCVLIPKTTKNLKIKKIFGDDFTGNFTVQLKMKNNFTGFGAVTPFFFIGSASAKGIGFICRRGDTIELSNKVSQISTDAMDLTQFASDNYLYFTLINDIKNNKAKMIINGISSTEIASANINKGLGMGFNIADGAQHPFDNYVNIFRFYNKVLSDAEIQQNYQYDMGSV